MSLNLPYSETTKMTKSCWFSTSALPKITNKTEYN